MIAILNFRGGMIWINTFKKYKIFEDYALPEEVVGTVVGCLFDIDKKTIAFTVNEKLWQEVEVSFDEEKDIDNICGLVVFFAPGVVVRIIAD